MSEIAKRDPRDITLGGLIITATGVEVEGEVTQEHIEGAFSLLDHFQKGVNWVCGDLQLIAEGQKGEEWAQQQLDTHFTSMSPETKKQCRWVAGRFTRVNRINLLPWSHHLLAAGIDDEVERSAILQKCLPAPGEEDKGPLPQSELRRLVKEYKGETVKDTGPKEPTKAELAEELVAAKAKIARLEQKCLDGGVSPHAPEPLICPNEKCPSRELGDGHAQADAEGDCMHCREPNIAEAEPAPWEECEPYEKPSDDQYPDQADPKRLAKAKETLGYFVRALDAINYPWATETLADIERGLGQIQEIQAE